MNEQEGAQALSKRRKTHLTSKQDRTQTTTPQPPANDNKKAWLEYWKVQGQHWRIEPEIDVERQKYLEERRSITPDIEQGIYPFKNIKLSRADIEWLLATHENGRGPVDWSDPKQRERDGIDLRGAYLSGVDLSGLPLACMRGGLTGSERTSTTLEQHNMASVNLEGADLYEAHLEGARLSNGHLEKADLYAAHLEAARLYSAHLEGARLRFAYLDSTTNLDSIFLGNEKYGFASVVDVRWSDVNLAMVNWAKIQILGDEQTARHLKPSVGRERRNRLRDYRRAVRANRQLAIALQSQGLNEDAARFSYRAQKLQRIVFRQQGKLGQYLFSGFLDLLAGYGYKPWRSFIAYIIVIIVFATAYYLLGQTVGPSLSPVGSFVFSMTSFHGRGFFPGGIKLDDPLTILAAIEAFVGLLIEVTFIATLTQRFFGK